MHFIIFCFLSAFIASYQEIKSFKPKNYQINIPKSILIKEATEVFWTKYKINRSLWNVSANSEQGTGTDGPIGNIVDNDTTTLWHSKHNNNGIRDTRAHTNDPFQITINLGEETTFRAFSYMPRQTGQNGQFNLYEFYVAQTEEELNTKILNSNYIAKGDIDPSERSSTLVILSAATTCQYIALRSLNHDTFGTCAEFNLYSDPPSNEPIQFNINETKGEYYPFVQIDRTGWSATANSEQNTGTDGPVSNILDGNPNTIWHSKYNNNGHHDTRPDPSSPFHFIVDLAKDTTFIGFAYMPRNFGQLNGIFNDYEFYYASSEDEINTKISNSDYAAKGKIDRTILLSTLVILNSPITARFVALRSLNHDSYATCAEFNLYTEPITEEQSFETTQMTINEAEDEFWAANKINSTGWVAKANSEKTKNAGNEGPITNILDGNPTTLWHSNYDEPGNKGHNDRPRDSDPFQFTIDLLTETTFKAFSYMPRPSNSKNGRFSKYEFYFAHSPEKLYQKIRDGNYVAKGDIDRDSDLSTFVQFNPPLTSRYVALRSLNHDSYATCSEFGLFRVPPPSPTPSQSATASATQSATESPTQSATQSPTQSATASATQSATQSPIATQTPMATPTLPPVPIPESAPVPISVSIDQMIVTGDKGCDAGTACPSDNFATEACGKKCWSQGDHLVSYEYTFIGEGFQVYGTYAQEHRRYAIYLDDELIDKVSQQIDGERRNFALQYTSNTLPYGEHKLKIAGIGEVYEMHKITYWPSLKSKRINSTEFSKTDEWIKESDTIGGIREKTNNNGATAKKTILLSKFWVIGTRNNLYNSINVAFGDFEANINENTSGEGKENMVVYESPYLPFDEQELIFTSVDKSIINCIYYLDEPAPATISQTPYATPTASKTPTQSATEPPTQSATESPTQSATELPTQTPSPDFYINKVFNNALPNGFINLDNNPNIQQISGCRFTNVDIDNDFLGTSSRAFDFFDNTFEYDEGFANPSIMSFSFESIKFIVSRSTFKNFRNLKKSGEGLIFSFEKQVEIVVESCNFINIGSEDTQKYFKINGNSKIQMNGCTFTSEDGRGCQICDFKFTDVQFDHCTFTRPVGDLIKIEPDNDKKSGTFVFTNNIVQNNEKEIIYANNIDHKPIINNNIFQNIVMKSGYLITLKHTVDEIELINNTYSQITTNTGKYGGGICCLYQHNNNIETTIIYSQCKFYDNINSNNQSPYNQGGAIQYGYSTSIANTRLILEYCEFKRNKCTSGSGGALGININRNLQILGCIFENNEASQKGSAIYIWGKIVKPDSEEAPEFSGTLEMESISITNCQFIGNKGLNDEGACIYIEEENIVNTLLHISESNFTNNGEDKEKFMIFNYCGEFIFENNKVEYTDNSKTSGAISSQGSVQVQITGSNFINCISSSYSSINIENSYTDPNSKITITHSEFNNCKSEHYVIQTGDCFPEIDFCTISFDSSDSESTCGGIDLGYNQGLKSKILISFERMH